MKTPPHEVLANDTTLLTFVGRVLELFGFGDAHRPHIRQGPRLEFGTGREPTMAVTRGQPGAVTKPPQTRNHQVSRLLEEAPPTGWPTILPATAAERAPGPATESIDSSALALTPVAMDPHLSDALFWAASPWIPRSPRRSTRG